MAFAQSQTKATIVAVGATTLRFRTVDIGTSKATINGDFLYPLTEAIAEKFPQSIQLHWIGSNFGRTVS
jgi:hypothetical protein